jgi:acetate kinase
MTAVAGGKAVDHSMGMTPLEGLVMGTRSGDLDPAIPLYMMGRGLSAQQVDEALNKASGLLGLSGLSNDMRDLLASAEGGHAEAKLAVEVFVYRVVKYVGAYFVVLPGLDAIVLTGGIGENSLPVRSAILQGLRRLGVRPDERRNERTVRGAAGPITADDSAVPVWVVPTNEELMIARDTRRIVEAG